MPSVREIAELAGVSKSTVSLVLNDKPGVSEEMRQLILEARDQLLRREERQQAFLQPDLMLGQDDIPLSVMVLHPPVVRSSYVFREVLHGIESAAQVYRLQLRLVSNDSNGSERQVSHLYLFDDQLRPDGLIVFGAKQHEPILDAIYKRGIPCVVLGREVANYDVSGVGRDEARYAFELTRYLLEQGHEAIGFVGGDQVYDYWHTRLQGYRKALDEAGVIVSESWIQPGDGAAATKAIFDSASEVTAVIFVNDNCAQAGLPCLLQAGFTIPDDLSVVSFDDTDFAQTYTPPITSISYRRFEEGQWAVKTLIDQIRFPYIERVQTIFQADLIVRQSCAAPRPTEVKLRS